MQKLTLTSADEKEKYYKDPRQQNEKIKSMGVKALETMRKALKGI